MVDFIWSAYRMVRKLNWQKVRTRRELPTTHCKPILSMLLVGLRYLMIGLRCQSCWNASGSPLLPDCWPIGIIPFVFVGPKRALARRDSSMVSVANPMKQGISLSKPFSILVRNQVDASANGRFLYLSSPCSFTFQSLFNTIDGVMVQTPMPGVHSPQSHPEGSRQGHVDARSGRFEATVWASQPTELASIPLNEVFHLRHPEPLTRTCPLQAPDLTTAGL